MAKNQHVVRKYTIQVKNQVKEEIWGKITNFKKYKNLLNKLVQKL